MSEASAIAEGLVADADGPAAPPRSNGELVFEAPWESRAFGVAVALSEGRALEWEQFRQALIAEIGSWEREHAGDAEARWSYYERWLASLERLLLEDGILAKDEIERRVAHLEHLDAHERDHHH
jgi:nitrile hydratase accessory protein